MASFWEWSLYHAIMDFKYQKKNGSWVWKCRMYDKKKGCLIYENRPWMCKLYPEGKTGSHKDCSYKGRKKTTP